MNYESERGARRGNRPVPRPVCVDGLQTEPLALQVQPFAGNPQRLGRRVDSSFVLAQRRANHLAFDL